MGDADEGVEVGVVVHIWMNDYGDKDAYIAMFGETFPEGTSQEKPHIFKYYVSGLELIED